ncbi:MAG TPA: hypothetical protein VLI54_03625 [Bacillota bacterium]|nr:hypothetical protein [Bacillota bacterium]
MSEFQIFPIGREDIGAPKLVAGGVSVVLQRHEEFVIEPSAENAGSITSLDAYDTDVAFFDSLIGHESVHGPKTTALFTASDSRYGVRGYRSVETTELAIQAMADVLHDHRKDSAGRVINLCPDFYINRHVPSDEDVRPVPALRERQPDERASDVLRRTHGVLQNFVDYARVFHTHNPNRHLVIWAGTHMGVISPLVRAITGGVLEDRLPVEYGGGVVINARPDHADLQLTTRTQTVSFRLGGRAMAGVGGF